MELTAAQQRVVDHDGGVLRVVGPAGTGKTTALVHRYLRLAGEVGASRVLVLARHRAAALRFRQAVLPHLDQRLESLSVITVWGFAFDLLRRRGRRPRLLTAAQQWALVRELLAAEAADARLWPTLHPLVGRRAFADQVSTAVLYAQATGSTPERARAAGEAEGGEAGRRWVELGHFLERYRAALATRDLVDGPGVVAEAAAVLGDPAVAEAERARHPHLLVDDHESATPVAHELVLSLAGPGGDAAVAGNPDVAVGSASGATAALFEALTPAVDVTLDVPFRRPAPPVLVRCGHPSLEGEAVAGELLEARARGVAWEDMAVLVRHAGRRGQAVVRALARNEIPVAPTGGVATEDPSVRGLIDLLRWVHGDGTALDRLLTSPLSRLDPAEVRTLRRTAQAAGTALEEQPALAPLTSARDALAARAETDDVATVAHQAFRLGLAHLVHGPGEQPTAAEERALDAVVSFLDQVSRHVERHPGTRLGDYLALLDAPTPSPDPWVTPPAVSGAVTVSPIAAAAGAQWDTVVLAGCVEGELPRVDGGPGFFDPAVRQGPPMPTADERRAGSVQEERRLFALACSRPSATLVAVAATEPGVLLSRFVEDWEPRASRLSLEGGRCPPAPPPTAGPEPLWPDGALHLSASQLDTYEDCPLKHGYRYALGVRAHGGVHANLGSLAHDVLELFCDPEGPVPPGARTLERLHELARERWRDDLAPYRPQLEEARRDLFDMLDLWWEQEGGVDGGPAVLATEHCFDVGVGPHRLTGRIDRVDRSDDGTGIRVVDYKTGKKRPRPEDVDEDLQLATYHLGASRDGELSAWGPVRQLRLLHLRTMTAFEQEIGADHTRRTEERILDAAARMVAEHLEPAVDAECDHCEVHRLCPLWPEGREVGSE